MTRLPPPPLKAPVKRPREVTADKLARLLAEHYGMQWASLNPHLRDSWRDRAAELLTFLDETPFSLLPPPK